MLFGVVHDVRSAATVWPWLSDVTGRVYCGRCLDAGFGRRDHPETKERTAWRQRDLPDAEFGCDGCGKPTVEWPSVDIETRGSVEFFGPCRIF